MSRIDPANPPYPLLRNLLRQVFTAETLPRFCQDRPLFRDLRNSFGPRAGLDDMIDDLFEFCHTRLLWEELLDGVAAHSPGWYNRVAAEQGWPLTPLPPDGGGEGAGGWGEVELHVRAGDGRYPVEIETPLAGDAQGILELPWTAGELRQRLIRLEYGPTDREFLAGTGHDLFQALFQGHVRDRYREALGRAEAGLRLRLRLDPLELQALPWELLYDAERDEFLALSGRVQVTRYLAVPRGTPPLRVPPPLRLLVVTASPRGERPLAVEAEVEAIRQALAGCMAQGLVQVEPLAHASVWTLRNALHDLRPHVLHFAGHGGVGEEGGVLLLEDRSGQADPLPGTTLGALLKETPTVRLAVLNACLSARDTAPDAPLFDRRRRMLLGVGPALVGAGLGAVVAAQFSLEEEAGRLFAGDFYTTLARLHRADQAVSRGRQALLLARGEGDRHWATPVLFLRAPDGVIFAPPTGQA